MTKTELFAKKAEMLTLLSPLGFADPDPLFLDLVHPDTSIVICCQYVNVSEVINLVFARALQRGEQATINRVKNSLGI